MTSAARSLAILALFSAAIVFLVAGTASAAAPDNALQFNGTSQYVRFGTLPSAADALNAAQFTLEVWFNRTGTGATTSTGTGGVTATPLIARGRAEAENSNVDMNYFMGIDATGKLVADFEEGSVAQGGVTPGLNHPITGNTTITNSVWHHAAATYDGQTWRLYLDGKLDGKLTLAGPIAPRFDSIQRTALGSALTSAGAAGGFFQGLLDEGRVWNLARTGAQIRANKDSEAPTPTTGLRGNWHLDETTGTSASDSSGQNMTGTLIATPIWVAGYTFPLDTTAPASVQNLAATPGDTTVGLGWSANSEPDLAGYNVYRALSTPVPTGGTSLNGTDLLQTTSFNDTGLTNGTLYHYAVVAVDGSNNPSTAVESSATPSAPAPPANALQFNGTTQYVTFGEATAGLGASQLTLETWFRRTGTGVGTSTGNGGLASAVPLVTKGRAEQETPANVNMNYFLGIDTATNTLAADFEDSATGLNHPILGSTAVTSNVWHHAVATYDGTTWRLYLDGRLDAKLLVGSFTPESSSIQHAALGSALTSATTEVPAGFFQGQLDEARVWNVARTGDEIRANKDDEIASAAGLRGRWGMNQASGNLTDSAGSNTGTLVGSPTYVAGYAFPQDGSAPATPQNLVAAAGNNQVSLGWSANSESDLAGYDVFRSTSSPVGTGGSPLNGGDLVSGTTFTDTTATNGTQYYYVVVAVDGANNSSTASNEVNATPAPGPPVFVGAGDVADCTRTQDTETAALVAGIPGDVFTIGDNVYETGTAAEFANCYDPTWGAFKARTRPAAGNHDFGNGATPGATPYFDYFNGVGNQNGPAGDRDLGYYSYNIGTGPNTWHVVMLNSECEPSTGYWLPGGCAEFSAQDLWLKADLANAPTNNIIAIWHKPRWSSAGNHLHMQQLWQDLYNGGADILLGGHWHNYERLAPMDASGASDPAFGVRQFIVGTGGASLSGFGTIQPTSEVRNSSTYGVIKFTLHASSYDWEFIPISGQTFTDSGSTSTHGSPSAPPVSRPVADFDGDGTTDVAIYRPSDGVWYIKGQPSPQWGGQAGDVPVPGDYNGGGTTDVAIYRPSNGVWYILGQPWWQWGGQAGDVPVPGDYNGDGTTDIAIYRPSEGVWYVKDLPWSQWGGQAGDVPVPGDYNGDGTTDVAIYRPSNGVWYILGQPWWQWGGQAGDVPVPGDYNGDGTTDIAVYRPSDGVWYVKDLPWSQWGGQAGDVPVPGDYNGDETTDVAIYRPSDGVWYILGQPWPQWGGQAGDIPLSIPPATRLAYYP